MANKDTKMDFFLSPTFLSMLNTVNRWIAHYTICNKTALTQLKLNLSDLQTTVFFVLFYKEHTVLFESNMNVNVATNYLTTDATKTLKGGCSVFFIHLSD